MEQDNLLIFEMFPDMPYREIFSLLYVQSAHGIMKSSENPVIEHVIGNIHPLQTFHGCRVYPEGYILLSGQRGVEEIVRDLPSAFNENIVPEFRKKADPQSSLDKRILSYEGRGLTFLEDPSKSDRFLYSCLRNLKINSYNTQISQNAIALLQRFGGKREIKALGELAAYAGLEDGSHYSRVVEPTNAWAIIEGMYSLN